MITIYAIFFVVSVLMAMLAYTSRVSKVFKAVAFSFMVTLGLFTDAHYRDQLGIPATGIPVGEFVYVHHVVVGDSIKLWIWTEERHDRLHIIPYDQETAEKLQEAKERTEGGVTQNGQFELEDEGGNPQQPSLEMDDWTGTSDTIGKG
jgi:hypothetical protein